MAYTLKEINPDLPKDIDKRVKEATKYSIANSKDDNKAEITRLEKLFLAQALMSRKPKP